MQTHDLQNLAVRMQSIATIFLFAGHSEKEAAAAALNDALADPRRREVLDAVLAVKTSSPGVTDAQIKFAQFFSDRLLMSDGSITAAKMIHAALAQWWALRRPMETLPTSKALGAALRSKGAKAIKKGGTIHYMGVRLLG